jgi:RNA polymerase sigma-70 factor (ECF subfamily)
MLSADVESSPSRTRAAASGADAKCDGLILAACITAVAERGDSEAFASLFKHFAPRVKTYVRRLGATPEAAEEAAQEALLTVWKRAGAFDPNLAAASTWIFTIARNLRIDIVRRESASRRSGIYEFVNAPELPDVGVVASEDSARISAALALLPMAQAEVVRLAFFSDAPHAKIAADLGVPLGTIKSRLRLAMARLQHILRER